MIVGNGMIAKAFKQYSDIDDVIIFASGVSNSQKEDAASFQREVDLLSSYSGTDKKLIYFSTCSIGDRSLVDSKYIQHKLFIEQYIQTNFKHYIVFRLPIVIGNSKNNDIFFNSFRNKILNKEKLTIYKHATRYIVDIDDLVCILPNLIDDKQCDRQIINIAFNNKATVLCLVNIFEDILSTKVEKEITDTGDDYTVDNSVFMNFVEANNYDISNKYNFIVLKKYLTWNE